MLGFCFEIFGNFMIFYDLLLLIKISSFYQKFRKFSAQHLKFFHLKIDRQTKIANSEIKKYFRICVKN